MNRYKLSMIFGCIGIILVSSLMILTTYAYFTVSVEEGETSDINLITFNENTDVIFNDTSNLSLINAYTGEEVIKEFSISNTSNYSIYYDIVFNNVVNNYSLNNYLVYELSSTNSGAKRVTNVMPREDGYIAKNVYIAPNSKQDYTLKITFLKKNENQNIDQNKTFSSNIKIVPSSNLNVGQKIYQEGSILSYIINDENINYTNSSTFGNTIYYYKGLNPNNNVIFNNMCFKIIRTDDDNNIKMIYNGEYINNKCISDNYIDKSAFNLKSDNNAYVGYMYGKASSNTYESEHENIVSSTIKMKLESWFKEKFNDLKQYFSNTAIYCNDRSMHKFTIKGVLFSTNGYAKTNTGYYDINNSIYDYICPNINDRFSVTNDYSNKSSNYPVGLISYNEYKMSLDNNKTFLNNKYKYWTMTPAYFNGNNAYNYVAYNGNVSALRVDSEADLIPVITIKKDMKIISGDGSNLNPYVLGGEV